MKYLLFVWIAACNTGPVRAYVLKDVQKLNLKGDAVDAHAGDIVLQSSEIITVIQRPMRDAGPAPYGGGMIDIALASDRIDRFGETMPFLNMGRTARFDDVRVVSDGSDGKKAVVEATGVDALWDFVNLGAVAPALLSYPGLLAFDANAEMGAKIRARYELGPNDDFVTVTYTVDTSAPTGILAGFAFDSGGAVDFFQKGSGFAGFSSFNPSLISSLTQATEYYALVGQDVAYGMRPTGGQSAVGVSVAGVTVMVPGSGNAVSILLQPNLSTPKSYGLEVQVGRTVAEVRARMLARDGAALGSVFGRIAGDTRLLALRPQVALIGEGIEATGFVEDGQFIFQAPPGTYTVALDLPGYAPLSSPPFTIAPGETADVSIDLPPAARIGIHAAFFDDPRASGQTPARPCRVSVFKSEGIAARPPTASRERNDGAIEDYLSACSGEIVVPPGTYMVQVSGGPFRDVFRQVVSVQDSVDLAPALHRIVDSDGIASADFHQHSVNSPDSTVALDRRVLGYAAEGIDFFASSDHDRVTNYMPLIESLGLADVLQHAPGVETTTFAYGHFNAWPMPFDPDLPSGGAIDWNVEAQSLLPRDIFAAFRKRGAGIIQVNHPRTTGSFTDFQNFFDRSGLVVDPDKGILGSDPLLQTVSNETLRLPPGETMFDTGFDAMEVLNGFGFTDVDGDGRVEEARAEDIMRDWLGFLAMGFRPTVVGVSDSHTQYRTMVGYPRTYVYGGAHSEDVQQALRAGRAVASNGPVLDVVLVGLNGATGGLGSLVSVGETAYLRVQVQAQSKAAIDRLDVYVNTWVQQKGAFKRTPEPLVPSITLDVSLQPVKRANGGVVYTALQIIPVNVTKDAFVVVRASGVEPLFPFLSGEGAGDPHADATTPEAFFTNLRGAPAVAIANPIFLDRDGDGAWTPPRERK